MTTRLSGPALAPANGQPPKRAVVLLHGYGANGNDLIALGRHWASILPDALFVAPDAPTQCAINPGGFEWFPLSGDRIADRIEGTEIAAPILSQFLADFAIQTGVPPEQTVLAGFSQGAMMALNVGTAMEQPLRAIISFSGAFIPAPVFGTKSLARPPVALIHGELDDVVDPQLSLKARDELQAAGFDVELHLSPGVAHGIAPDGLDFATRFLQSITD